MNACRVAAPLVTAYIDGELVGDDRASFESHVAACVECRRCLEDEQGVVAAVRASLPLYGAPPPLRARVEGLLDHTAPPHRAWRVARGAGAAALALALAALAVVGVLRARPAAPASEFAALAVDTHLRYDRGQLPLEVTSGDAEGVARWFHGRVPFRLALPDYPVAPGETKPYRLEGGRLVSFQRDYAAYLAYRMDGEPVSLLVTSSDRVDPRGGEIVMSGALRFHVETVSGLNVITWSDKGLTYALASDVTVPGARSCLVCHGSPAERRRLDGFSPRPPI